MDSVEQVGVRAVATGTVLKAVVMRDVFGDSVKLLDPFIIQQFQNVVFGRLPHA